MLALVTGGSSGIGLGIIDELLSRGYDILSVSRTKGSLADLERKYPQRHIEFLPFDLSKKASCFRLLEETKERDIDVFVSNAGFGKVGYLEETSLEEEIDMVELNDLACLLLGKSFLLRFLEKGECHLLFVSSAAAFGPAPYSSLYNASKVFVSYLAHGYHREVKNAGKKVTISILYPGPVETGFAKRAGIRFSNRPMTVEKVSRIAVTGMLKGKLEIVPGFSMKVVHVLSHIVPKRLITCLLDKRKEMV